VPTSTRSRTVKVNMGQVNITPLHAVCIATDAPTCRQAGISARPSRFRDLLGSQVISPRPFELTTPIVVGVLTTFEVFSSGGIGTRLSPAGGEAVFHHSGVQRIERGQRA
jgi:hypothetical protein